MNKRTSVLLGLFCCSALAGNPVLADTNDDGTDPVASAVPEISLWVKQAPLSLVIKQLAQLSGRDAVVDSTLDAPVSGRFNGNLEQVMVELSADYPVLFDLDENTLSAVENGNLEDVSMAIVSEELSDEFKSALFEQLAPGNDIEIRTDAIRVSGHPDFVKRTTDLITRVRLEAGASPVVELASEDDVDAPVTGVATATEEADQMTSETITDAGSEELLADMAEEGKPPAEQAVLSRPIRWVTDIPGFDTF